MQQLLDLATFGDWLKRRRRALDLTQSELAARVGCTASMLQKLEQGARQPSPELAERLTQVLGAAPGVPTPAAPALLLPLRLTKVTPPPLRRDAVARARLTRRLSQADGGVTLVVAPAGWGKTTLLADWAAQTSAAAQGLAWLTLDEHDLDVTLVLRYLVAAIQRRHPALGATALDILNTPQPSVEAVLTMLLNNIVESSAPIILVLDDYHRVRAPAVRQMLTALIEQLPPSMRLIIASREDPALPLARLRARGQLHEIRAADLRFTVAEAAVFFAEAMQLPLEAQELAVLATRTEGWITGLQLAALALREQSDRADFIAAFSGDHRLVLDYLTEEVLATLPAHLHEFLLQTSILEQLSGPLCDAVLGVTSDELQVTKSESEALVTHSSPPIAQDSYSQLVLEQLERANLFVVPVDGQRRWYRYHQLFGAALRLRLQSGGSPRAVAALHERAALWFEGHGMLSEAADHAVAGGQWQRASQLIVKIGDALLLRGSIERLRSLIAALPAAVRDDDPQLLQLHGRCVRQVYDLAAGRALFEQAAAGFARLGDDASRGVSLIHLSDCCRMLGAYAAAHDALAVAIAGPLPPGQRAVALLSRMYEEMVSDNWPAVIPALAQALEPLTSSDDRQALHDIATNLTSLVAFLPGGSACLARLRQLIARQPPPPLSLLHAADLFAHGLLQLTTGQIDAAHSTFTRLIAVNDQIGTISQTYLETVLWYAHTATLCGDFANASERLDRLLALLKQPALALYRQQNGTFYTIIKCLLDWTQGRAEAVQASATEAEMWANHHEWPIQQRVRSLMRALVLIDRRDWAAAECELINLSRQQQAHEMTPFGDAQLLLAHVYHTSGRAADALRMLETALAAHEQYVTPGSVLLLGPAVIAPLLRLALAHGVRAPFAARVLSCIPQPATAPTDFPAAAPAEPDDAELLTTRELEVLRLIAAGLNNPEIAARMVVSVATVKKHINNIFAKLHAQSRTQALVRARARGLV